MIQSPVVCQKTLVESQFIVLVGRLGGGVGGREVPYVKHSSERLVKVKFCLSQIADLIFPIRL